MNKIILIIGLLMAKAAQGQNALLIPDTLSGTNISLTLQYGTHQFYSGQNTATMGTNGDILGPTLLLKQGDFVNFSVNNQISDTTTIHWHGLHVAPENDGGPHTTIPPNTTWNPSFTILDKAATYWYHPHLHKKTNEHVSKGIAGLILVRDDDEANLVLPRTYGIDDFPLVIQTKDFSSTKEIIINANSDDVVMVNATIDPFLQVPSQVVRCRVLNGSSQRVFNIGLSNNQSFYQIASDGGLLSAPFQTTRLLLSPGERAELLIDFTEMNGQTVYLKSFASELPNGIYGAANPGMGPGMSLAGYHPNPLNGSDFNVLQFNIVGQTASPITTIPASLVPATPIPVNRANITRTLIFSSASMGPDQLNGDFLINSTSFDMDVINYSIPFDNTEIWQLTNQSPISHPFHIHDVQFYILSRNGVAPPINEQGRKDVVLVKPMETVRFITKFEDFGNPDVPYMYHCHLLTHEDRGMMGQFIVSNPLSINDGYLDTKLKIYPNPTDGLLYIEFEEDVSLSNIEIYDLLGRIILDATINIQGNNIRISELPAGLLFLKIHANNQTLTKKIIVK